MRGRTMRAAFVAAAGVLASSSAHAAAMHYLEIDSERDCHRVFSVTYIDAPPDAVFKVLTDYDAFERISSIYEESRVLERDSSGGPVVYTRIRACFLIFCKSLSRVEVLELREPDLIRATVLPERSDVAFGQSEWKLEPAGHGTLVTYRASIRIELPPMLGPWLLKSKLRAESAAAAHRVEGLARSVNQ